MTRPASKLAVFDIRKPEIVSKALEVDSTVTIGNQDIQPVEERVHNEQLDVQQMGSVNVGENVVDKP